MSAHNKGVVVASRFHDISCGHRVFGHESKCAHLHGHNYRFHFNVVQEDATQTDKIGRVMDFSVIKSLLCMWLEDNWDHKFLIWENDPAGAILKQIDPNGVVVVPFNPTAENMAQYLVDIVAPRELLGSGCVLIVCKIEETYKCHASYFSGNLPSLGGAV